MEDLISIPNLLHCLAHRVPPVDYPFKHPVYDLICYQGTLIIPLYQNDFILLLNMHDLSFVGGIGVSHCHSVFIEKETLVVSTHRDKRILGISLTKIHELVFEVQAEDFHPISIGYLGQDLLCLDYLGSRIVRLDWDELHSGRGQGVKSIRRHNKRPHSIKQGHGLSCITWQDEPSIEVYNDKGVMIDRITYSKIQQPMMASPVSRFEVIVVCVCNGLFLYDLKSRSLRSLIHGGKRLTCAAVSDDVLYLGSEMTETIHVIRQWRKILELIAGSE